MNSRRFRGRERDERIAKSVNRRSSPLPKEEKQLINALDREALRGFAPGETRLVKQAPKAEA